MTKTYRSYKSSDSVRYGQFPWYQKNLEKKKGALTALQRRENDEP